MAGRSRPTLQKRLREQNRDQKRREKEQRREERKREGGGDPSAAGSGPDPDLDGIVPGPQRQPWMED